MTRDYLIEKINYDLISNAVNINPLDRSKLFGYSDHYVAVKPVNNGYHILMETIGKRDECINNLRDLGLQNIRSAN